MPITATARLGSFDLDFVNLRTESYSETSRIPVISIGTPTEDALRRDLTINSLFYNIHTKQVEDFTGNGINDLMAGIIRTPLPALITLKDDPLRALRCIRFACRFGFSVSSELSDACKDSQVHSLIEKKVSKERITAELSQMLQHPAAPRALLLLYRYGILQSIFEIPSNWCIKDGVDIKETYHSVGTASLLLSNCISDAMYATHTENNEVTHPIQNSFNRFNDLKNMLESSLRENRKYLQEIVS